MLTDLLFGIGYIIIFDYLVFALSCKWNTFSNPEHMYFGESE